MGEMFIAGGKTLVMLMALIYSGRKFGTYITSDGQARLHSYTCTHAQAFSLAAVCFLSLLAFQILGGLEHDTTQWDDDTHPAEKLVPIFFRHISLTTQCRYRVFTVDPVT